MADFKCFNASTNFPSFISASAQFLNVDPLGVSKYEVRKAASARAQSPALPAATTARRRAELRCCVSPSSACASVAQRTNPHVRRTARIRAALMAPRKTVLWTPRKTAPPAAFDFFATASIPTGATPTASLLRAGTEGRDPTALGRAGVFARLALAGGGSDF